MMNDINKQQQAAVAAYQNSQQQQQQAAAQVQMQQQVEGQTIQVQQVQLAHDGSDPMHASGAQVASTNATINQQSAMVMQAPQQTLISQQAMQNIQSPPGLTPIHSQAGSTTITTMSTGPQQMADWAGHGRVQVIQQPIQNPTYIQPVYNGQGQLIVPGNIALHPGNINQPIQVITAGKAFQPGQMPHMLTATQGKPIVQGQAASFPGYTTIPTSGNNQTLVISQLGVLGQANLLPQQQQGKPQEMQKLMTKNNVGTNNIKNTPNQQQNVSLGNLVSSQPQGMNTQTQTIIQPQILSPIQYTCNTQQQRAVPQATTPAMQFAPWQATFGTTGLPQGLTWAPGAIQSSALLTQSSQIFIRNPHPDQPGMFIHNAQPSTIPQHNQIQGQPVNKTNPTMEIVQPKAAIRRALSNILPNSIGSQQIRPASSVSTQTGQTQTIHQANFQMKGVPRIRSKSASRVPNVSTSKVDPANQSKTSMSIQNIQPKYVISNTPSGPALVSQEKVLKPIHSQGQLPQQPLVQIQQMQSMFSESVETKPSGQLLVTNGVQNGGTTIVPVASIPAGQIAPVMTTTMAQNEAGLSSMSPECSIPPTPSTPLSSVNQEVPTANVVTTLIKEESSPVKNTIVEEKNSNETEPDRLAETVSEGAMDTLEICEKAEPLKTEANDKGKSTEPGDKGKSEENKENKKLSDKEAALGHSKAMMMVKPQVLTHVIEGYVIQESSKPFPINRGSGHGLIRKIPISEILENGEPARKMLDSGKDRDVTHCETCKKKGLKSEFKDSMFCSSECHKRFNIGWGSDYYKSVKEADKKYIEEVKEAKKKHEENIREGKKREEDKSRDGKKREEKFREGRNKEGEKIREANNPKVESKTNETSKNVLSSSKADDAKAQSAMIQDDESKINPVQWSVSEVCEFIKTLPGCSEYVEDFAMQDIDGEALMLLKPDHLMSVMSMKLGPAVKIIAKIDTMRNGETSPEN